MDALRRQRDLVAVDRRLEDVARAPPACRPLTFDEELTTGLDTARFALCSACSMATMRGADRSHIRLFADSRYQLQSTFLGMRRAVSIDDFHDARVSAAHGDYFGLGLKADLEPHRGPAEPVLLRRYGQRAAIAPQIGS